MMKSQELFQEIDGGKILPLYYFYGPEEWLIEEALKKIKEKALNPATLDFNREVLDAEEDFPEAILGSLQVFPLNSPRRLVVIRQADVIWSKGPAPYFDYFANPNPSTCAVFIGEKVDLRTKFFQALEKNGAVVSFYPPYERELIRWIRFQAEQLGHSISDEALSLLLERIGPNLQELKLELQKLTLQPGTKKFIQEEDVLALTEDIREESPFELPWAVGHLDWEKSLRLLRKNLQQGNPPLLLLSLILRQLRLIRRARELRVESCSKKEVETKLRILPQRANDFWKQVDKLSPSALEQIWPLTRETDLELKSSRLDKGLILEKYLWDLFFLGRGKIQNVRGK
jgi:DNA polymerase-3 subunit delta